MPHISPYGTWVSPISAADTVGGVVTFSGIQVDDSGLYWVEGRPMEGGRQVLVRRDADGNIADVTPPPVNVRTLVHEYGGAPYLVDGGRVVYSEFSDQRLHVMGRGPLTAEPKTPRQWRYADARPLPDGWLVCVGESHYDEEVINELVVVDPSGSVETLVSGRDFYSSPRASPEGNRLLWLEWDHPNMPWDGTELMMADLREGGVTGVTRIAGGPDESVFQPEWGPDGTITFISDRTGWWNLYRYRDAETTPIHPLEADFGLPAWLFGATTYGLLSGGRILAGYWDHGVQRLVVIGPGGAVTPLPTEYSMHEYLVTDGESRAWFGGIGAGVPTALCELDVDTGEVGVIRANPMPADVAYFPAPRAITYPTGEGAVAHAIFYPPTNPEFRAPDGDLPPLMVMVHGGPTSQVVPRLLGSMLFWTTRGFAVVDLNYRGSTGYGRDYRNQLRDNWGITDVEDSLAAVRYLAGSGAIDPERAVIRGGSAGGYTTLAALAFGDGFRAGASYYGVADIALLNAHTHKFESRYLDGLTGTDPEELRRRSPLYSADQISVPVILFQGLEDRVVPPEQSVAIADALAANGVPHALITYEGEDHGFRRADTIIHSLEAELAFYGKVLGFTPAGDLPEIDLR